MSGGILKYGACPLIASDEASFITGAELFIDDGMSIRFAT